MQARKPQGGAQHCGQRVVRIVVSHRVLVWAASSNCFRTKEKAYCSKGRKRGRAFSHLSRPKLLAAQHVDVAERWLEL